MDRSRQSTECNPPAALRPAEIHLWRVVVSSSAASDAAAAAALSEDERMRAYRFHFEADRSRFVASHAALRRILRRTSTPRRRRSRSARARTASRF
jgi:4'-phosphopantetheinyl transferase